MQEHQTAEIPKQSNAFT